MGRGGGGYKKVGGGGNANVVFRWAQKVSTLPTLEKFKTY